MQPCVAAVAPLPSSHLLVGSCHVFESCRCEVSLYTTCTSVGIYSICTFTTTFLILFLLNQFQLFVFCALTKTRSRNVPMISKKSSARTAGPLSIGLPDPLKTRPANTHIQSYRAEVTSVWTVRKEWDIPNMSSDTGVRKMSPVNSQLVFLASIPEVPSNTCRQSGGHLSSLCMDYSC